MLSEERAQKRAPDFRHVEQQRSLASGVTCKSGSECIEIAHPHLLAIFTADEVSQGIAGLKII